MADQNGFFGTLAGSMQSPLFLGGAGLLMGGGFQGMNAGIQQGLLGEKQKFDQEQTVADRWRQQQQDAENMRRWNTTDARHAEMHPLDLKAKLAQISATGISSAHQMAAERRAQELHPYEVLMRDRNLNAPPDTIKTLKDGETMWSVDPRPNSTGVPRATQVAGGTETDKPYRDAAAKGLADIHKGFIEEGQKSVAATSDLQRMQELSNVVGSGKYEAWKPTVGPWLQSMGVDIRGQSEAEAFQAIASKMAPNMRPSGSGSTSDRDMGIFMSSLPQLSQTAEGRQLVLDQMKAFHSYSQARGRISSDAITGKITARQAQDMIEKMPTPFALMHARAGNGGQSAPQQNQVPQQQGGLQPGRTATNPQTGEKIMWDGQKWTKALPSGGIE